MAIIPTGYSAAGVEVRHDERGHGGVVSWDALAFARTPAGVLDDRHIILPCPVAGCNSASLHPVSGGADPERVQRLFIRAYLASADVPATTWEAALALVKARAGGENWRGEGDEDDGAVPIRKPPAPKAPEVRGGRD
jgi:hypothetical protein